MLEGTAQSPRHPSLSAKTGVTGSAVDLRDVQAMKEGDRDTSAQSALGPMGVRCVMQSAHRFVTPGLVLLTKRGLASAPHLRLVQVG